MNVELPAESPEVTIVVPARNEEACLGDCLASLVAQTGVTFEIIVVDDHSADRTGEIARGFAGVRVISPGPLPEGWTGKNNAVVAGAKEARGEWLLFTDSDTVHLPGSLARALAEAKEHGAELLSYSPEQIVVTFAEKAVMPVIFAELAAQYPPAKVREQRSGVVAANGQYMLVKRCSYEAVGGHEAVARDILEDVALAARFKDAGERVFFRYGGDAVRTRMYRSWRQLREGWSKNLALLFPRPVWLASWIMACWAFSWITLVLFAASVAAGWRAAYYALPAILLYLRIGRGNFSVGTNLVALGFGPPVFAYLLLRSKNAHSSGGVSWKGRTYGGHAGAGTATSHAESDVVSRPSGTGAKAVLASRH